MIDHSVSRFLAENSPAVRSGEVTADDILEERDKQFEGMSPQERERAFSGMTAAERAIFTSTLRQYSAAIDGKKKPIRIANGTATLDPGETPERPAFDIDLVIPATAFVEMPITPREDIVEGIMFTQSLNSLVGPRGLGKTRVLTTLGNAVTKAHPFFSWNIIKPRRFLLIDGELPAADLKPMILDHCDGAPSPLFDVVSSEFFNRQEGRSLNLNEREHQVKLIGLLESLERANRRPELIGIDNRSALTFGLDEDDNSAQDVLLAFLIDLRHRGYAVLFLEHTGWTGEHSRGASRREDFLDLSIGLKPLTPGPVPTCRFKLEFSKVRRKPPSPLSLECELVETDRGLEWTFRPGEGNDQNRLAAASAAKGEANLDRVAKVLTEIPRSSADLEELTNLSRSTVLEHLNRLKTQGRAETVGSGRNTAWILSPDREKARLGRSEEAH